jgi:hypothetical protein
MNDYTCSCGYNTNTADDLDDHIGEMVIAIDDIAPDGQWHAEIARTERGAVGPNPAGWRCGCGFASGTATGLDEHLVAAFTEPDPGHRPI